MSCSKCQKEKQIVNKKYSLCYECNFERTHKGETIHQYQQRKSLEYRARSIAKSSKKLVLTPSRQNKPIKQQTSKESSIKSKLNAIKKEIRLEAIQNNEYFCKGCGETGVLDCSHILSVGLYKHLELIKENIQLLCRQCHGIWGEGYIWEKMRMGCFESNLEIMAKYDEIAYNKLFNAWQDELNNYFSKN